MIINRHSIQFKINLIFIIALAAVVFALLIMVRINDRAQQRALMHKIPKMMKTVQASGSLDAAKLADVLLGHDLIPVPAQEARAIRRKAHRPGPPPEPHHPIIMLRHAKALYLQIDRGDVHLLFKDVSKSAGRFDGLILLLIAVILFLILLYGWIRRGIRPIKTLQRQIERYGEGERDIDIRSDRQDEIGQLANALHEALSKIETLTTARRLFMRNILHELNTPITKGRLIAELSDGPNKPILENIFHRLESLIQELVEVEKMTSNLRELHVARYRTVELVDDACERLYLDAEVDHALHNASLACDFTLMSIVFKNLIDNGIKYGGGLQIAQEDDGVHFISRGAPLAYAFEYYLQPFMRQGEGHETGGFGLGLYIAHEIITQHGYTLQYHHKDGKNDFTLIISSKS